MLFVTVLHTGLSPRALGEINCKHRNHRPIAYHIIGCNITLNNMKLVHAISHNIKIHGKVCLIGEKVDNVLGTGIMDESSEN